MEGVVVSAAFDNIRSLEVRFLEEARRLGRVHIYLWSDRVVRTMMGSAPIFPQEERQYLVQALRYVHKVWIVDQLASPDELPQIEGAHPGVWVVPEWENTPRKRDYCAVHGITYQTIQKSTLQGFPVPESENNFPSTRRKVLVTGCFDWFHSGHVRFFEETSQLGDLYVVVGHDENVRLLKGEGHPLLSEAERRYMVGAVRFVKEALISSGHGWMDAEPEIELIKPDIYAVNQDGDQPEKRQFCEEHGLQYVVLKRAPAAGLPRRESTQLRGF